MPHNDQVILNWIAQSLLPLDDGHRWFSGLSPGRQRDVLRTVSVFVVEAGASPLDVAHAVERAGVKPGSTPVVLLRKGSLKVQLAKVIALPEAELGRSFRLLVSVFSIADERRRTTRCQGGCRHWWHQDPIKWTDRDQERERDDN